MKGNIMSTRADILAAFGLSETRTGRGKSDATIEREQLIADMLADAGLFVICPTWGDKKGEKYDAPKFPKGTKVHTVEGTKSQIATAVKNANKAVGRGTTSYNGSVLVDALK